MKQTRASYSPFYYILIAKAIFVLIALAVMCQCDGEKKKLDNVILCQGSIVIPKHCKNLGLLGSTPHPTQYLIDHDMDVLSIQNITLDSFLDCQALKDSFQKTFVLCKERGVDCLVIAYLPVYFAKLKMKIKDQCADVAYRFFQQIAPQIQKIIQEVAAHQHSTMQIIVHLPTRAQCAKIPEGVRSDQHYCQYLIKQFPPLDWKESMLEKITIINTQVDDRNQTNDIIKYLQYEYLFARPVEFESAEIDKKTFHTYKKP